MTEAQPVVVVMVPFPAQGHLNQLLHFSRQIAARGLPVHFVGSAAHNHQAQLRVHGWNPLSVSNIRFHDFPLPHQASPPPDPLAPHSFPAHLQPTFEAATVHLRSHFSALVRSLSSTFRRVAVIHDPLMSFAAQESSTLPNVESYAFHCISAVARFCFQLKSLGSLMNGKMKTPISLQAVSWEGCFTDRFMEFVRSQHPMMAFDAGSIYNSCWPIEGEFLDMLSEEPFLGKGNRLWAVGPVNPIVVDRGVRTSHGCLEWLDKQPPRSVLYISFGTLSSLSKDQVPELAKGLERSGQRFIWVLREADRGDIFSKEEEEKETNGLPEGFEKRVRGVGVVVRDWAPQLEILAHRSTGGFMSHCGWNSCIESIGTGVPIAAWPMHSDQPRNTVLVAEFLRMGIVVREWGRREELVRAAAVETVVRRLMASKEGDEMRKRAAELAVKVGQAVAPGGSSHAHLQSFISHILRR
ncbi:hypothetical protein AAC387_Pa01g3599 [Persea americana]